MVQEQTSSGRGENGRSRQAAAVLYIYAGSGRTQAVAGGAVFQVKGRQAGSRKSRNGRQNGRSIAGKHRRIQQQAGGRQ